MPTSTFRVTGTGSLPPGASGRWLLGGPGALGPWVPWDTLSHAQTPEWTTCPGRVRWDQLAPSRRGVNDSKSQEAKTPRSRPRLRGPRMLVGPGGAHNVNLQAPTICNLQQSKAHHLPGPKSEIEGYCVLVGNYAGLGLYLSMFIALRGSIRLIRCLTRALNIVGFVFYFILFFF